MQTVSELAMNYLSLQFRKLDVTNSDGTTHRIARLFIETYEHS